MYLVLFETSSNQAFIFATNKLRENVGASELTAQATTRALLEAVRALQGPALDAGSPADLRKGLLDPVLNPPIEAPDSSGIEILLATSGKAALLVTDESRARALVTSVSAWALEHAPGLTLTGVMVRVETGNMDRAFSEAHQQLEQARWHLPGPPARFQRLPFVAECRTSGMPAAYYDDHRAEPGEDGPRSFVADRKRRASESDYTRINQILRNTPERFPRILEDMEAAENRLSWLAVIHADGNALGTIFQNFANWLKLPNGPTLERDRKYLVELRRFSLAVEQCTENAFRDALQAIPRRAGRRRDTVLLLPLVLGGDDLTVMCDGTYALDFASRYLRAFEDWTARRDLPLYADIIPRIAERALNSRRLTACAGVALVKPNFPFFSGYELAEDLLKSAKQVKKRMAQCPASALDFHVLYDSSAVGLDTIRRSLTLPADASTEIAAASDITASSSQRLQPGVVRLFARPYVVTPRDRLDASLPWWRIRHWNDLEQRVAPLQKRDEDGRWQLPRSQMHYLREGLFLRNRAADGRLNLLLERYPALRALLPDAKQKSLFIRELSDGTKPERHDLVTPFADALEIVDFISPGGIHAD